MAVDPLNAVYTNADGVFFDKGQRTLIQYPARNPASSYTVPTTVTNIGDFAFECCSVLTNLNIPASVNRIGTNALIHGRNLMAIIVDALNSAYSSADGVLFDNGKASLIQ